MLNGFYFDRIATPSKRHCDATSFHFEPAPVRQLPAETITLVADALSGKDRLNWSMASTTDGRLLAEQVHSVFLESQAKNISCLGQFQKLLAPCDRPVARQHRSILALPAALQCAPLAALARRIAALPLHVQADARATLLAVVTQLPAAQQSVLQESSQQAQSDWLTQAAHQVVTFAHFQQLLGSLPEQESAKPTIRNLRSDLQAQPLAALAARICTLPQAVHAEATQQFRAVLHILPPVHRIHLNDFSDGCPHQLQKAAAFFAVKSGESVINAASRYAIRDLRRIAQMENLAVHGRATDDIRRGDTFPATAARYGITGPVASGRLERLALTGPAADAARAGESLPTILTRYQITNPVVVYGLSRLSAQGPAATAIRNGLSAGAAARRFGITDPSNLHYLWRAEKVRASVTLAAQAQTNPIEPVDGVARVAGPTRYDLGISINDDNAKP